MAIRVNPTRMELSRLKKRLKTAVRGHKLLKDKRDEMVRRFILYVKKNRELRVQVEESLAFAMSRFALAKAKMGEGEAYEALFFPVRDTKVTVGRQNIMSVNVPTVRLADFDGVNDLPYGFAFSSSELDGAVLDMAGLLPKLIELAEMEKTCDMLADEIEKTRRRVNALEYVRIPELETVIKRIAMKLDENERGSLNRLMKVKEMMAAEKENA